MRQKSTTCNRRYLRTRSSCQAPSDKDRSVALRQTQGLERAAGHSDFVILSSFDANRLGLFVLRHSSTRDLTHLDSSAVHDHDWSIQQEQTKLVFGTRYF